MKPDTHVPVGARHTDAGPDLYRVDWTIELAARSHRGAARDALAAIREHDATVFTVTALATGATVTVDLDDLDDLDEDTGEDSEHAAPTTARLATRRERFNLLLAGYCCKPENWVVNMSELGEDAVEGFHATMPARIPEDAATLVPRWVLICEQESKTGFAAGVSRRSEIPAVAAEAVDARWVPRCYYDLDESGQRLAVWIGDRVEILDADDPQPMYVTRLVGVRGTHLVGLAPTPEEEPDRLVYPDRVRALDRAETDPPPRLPRRYLAGDVEIKVRFEDSPTDTREFDE